MKKLNKLNPKTIKYGIIFGASLAIKGLAPIGKNYKTFKF